MGGLLGDDPDTERMDPDCPLAEKQCGALGRKLTLQPGETGRVDFIISWHFPNQTVHDGGHHYAARFFDARAAAAALAEDFERLCSATRLWCDTWYDSTLPHWFLNRTFANTSTLATTTCLRFRNGRFWAWEGVNCCPGTCTHVWQYAQAPGRLFPELERRQRIEVDFGLALGPDGAIAYRAEEGDTFAVDGQCGRILGALREHQMSADASFLKSIWPAVKKALQKLIATDGDGDGLLIGPLHNTLDADWHGLVPWINGLYHAALRAGEVMAREMDDAEFAARCRGIFEAGVKNLDQRTWREDFGYYIQEPGVDAPRSIGTYDGCHIDQVFGQSWAHQVGLGPVMDPAHSRRALQSLWDCNFTPDVGPYRDVNKPGRWYAMPGEGGLLMVTHPFTPEGRIIGRDHWSFMYFNECMSGFEHQVASHMIHEGMLTEGLAVTRAIHDRYHPSRRNPYNEVECSDHYARAMASYGSFLAACGFEIHGPSGHIGFVPKISPEDFRAAFTAPEGWGTYAQASAPGEFTASLTVRHGRLALRSLALALVEGGTVRASVAGKQANASLHRENGRSVVRFPQALDIKTGESLQITITP